MNGTCVGACQVKTCLDNETDTLVCMTDPEFAEYNTCVDLSAFTATCDEAADFARSNQGPLVLDLFSEDGELDSCANGTTHVAAIYAPRGLSGSAYTEVIKAWDGTDGVLTYSAGVDSGTHPDIEAVTAEDLADVVDFFPGEKDVADFNAEDFYFATFFTCGSVDVVFVVDRGDDATGGTEDDLWSNAFCVE